MDPLSNQPSNTSGILLRAPLPYFEGIVIWSIDSLWRSVIGPHPESSYNSAIEPTQTISSMSSEAQIGIGFPQNLLLEKHQSLASESQFLKRFSCTNAGTHLGSSLFFSNYCLRSVTLINQVSTALYISGVYDLQQNG